MSIEVIKIFIDKKEQKKIEVDEFGIIEDKHYAKDLDRSILITSPISYEIAKTNNIPLNIGELSENIYINLNIYNLNIGSTLRIGEVELQITQHCTLCKHLTKINSKLPKLLKNDRGVFTKVIKSGVIKIGDKIEIFKT